MLYYWGLHNIRNLEITISGGNKLFELLEDNNFSLIRRAHIIIDFDWYDKIDLCYSESSEDGSEDDIYDPRDN
jgi:hypothetical protein